MSDISKQDFTRVLEEIIGDLPEVSNNHKLLAKFHSGTLKIMDTMKLMSLFLNSS